MKGGLYVRKNKQYHIPLGAAARRISSARMHYHSHAVLAKRRAGEFVDPVLAHSVFINKKTN